METLVVGTFESNISRDRQARLVKQCGGKAYDYGCVVIGN
jgi:hypothetical protein